MHSIDKHKYWEQHVAARIKWNARTWTQHMHMDEIRSILNEMERCKGLLCRRISCIECLDASVDDFNICCSHHRLWIWTNTKKKKTTQSNCTSLKHRSILFGLRLVCVCTLFFLSLLSPFQFSYWFNFNLEKAEGDKWRRSKTADGHEPSMDRVSLFVSLNIQPIGYKFLYLLLYRLLNKPFFVLSSEWARKFGRNAQCISSFECTTQSHFTIIETR